MHVFHTAADNFIDGKVRKTNNLLTATQVVVIGRLSFKVRSEWLKSPSTEPFHNPESSSHIILIAHNAQCIPTCESHSMIQLHLKEICGVWGVTQSHNVHLKYVRMKVILHE